MLTIVFLATLFLPICLAGERCSKKEGCSCAIAGKWQNELGSNVTFTCKDGKLGGTYVTAVGIAKYPYKLSGRYTPYEEIEDALVLGLVVSYNNEKYGNSNSSASWSGIYYPKENVILTQWLLTRFQPFPDYWESTMVNHDEFHRIVQQNASYF